MQPPFADCQESCWKKTWLPFVCICPHVCLEHLMRGSLPAVRGRSKPCVCFFLVPPFQYGSVEPVSVFREHSELSWLSQEQMFGCQKGCSGKTGTLDLLECNRKSWFTLCPFVSLRFRLYSNCGLFWTKTIFWLRHNYNYMWPSVTHSYNTMAVVNLIARSQNK